MFGETSTKTHSMYAWFGSLHRQPRHDRPESRRWLLYHDWWPPCVRAVAKYVGNISLSGSNQPCIPIHLSKRNSSNSPLKQKQMHDHKLINCHINSHCSSCASLSFLLTPAPPISYRIPCLCSLWYGSCSPNAPFCGPELCTPRQGMRLCLAWSVTACSWKELLRKP